MKNSSGQSLGPAQSLFEQIALVKERLEEYIDNSAEFLLVTDKRGRILKGNRKVDEFTAKAEGENTLSFVKNAFGSVFWQKLMRGIDEIEANPAGRYAFETNLESEQTLRNIEWTMRRLSGLSERRGPLYEIVGNDVTRLKSLYAALVEKDRELQEYISALEELLARHERQKEKIAATAHLTQLGELAGGIAHEINNPIQVVQMSAEILLDQVQRKEKLDPSIFEKNLAKILQTCTRVADIIRSMKSLSKTGSSEEFQPTNISELLELATAFYKEKFKSDAIRFEIKIDPALVIECRPTQISQVVINLLNNAYQAALKQANPWVQIIVTDHFDSILMRFIDSGPGLSAEAKARWSQPFYTTKASGMGIGLSIACTIATHHGGSISYDDRAEHTTFEVRLPKRQTHDASSS